ncbi:MAG: tetratricopeptide repeat protein [Pseudomonadota bacterium]
MTRWLNTRFIFLLLLATAGCERGARVADLEPVPVVETSRYLPVIQAQFADAMQAVDESPGNPDVNAQLGRLLYTYDQFESAAVLFERAAALQPREFIWPYLSGRARAELGQTERAEQSLTRALALESRYAPINVHLAELYLKANQDAAARDAAERILEHAPERPEAHFILAKLAVRDGKFTQALARLQRVEQLSGRFAALHYQYSQTYRMLNQPDQADVHLRLYEQLREVTADIKDPVMGEVHALNQSVDYLVSQAKWHVANGRNEPGLALLERAVENNPQSLAAHVTLVGVYSSNRRFADADRHIAAASAIDENHPKLQYAIGVARMIEERRTEATRAFERALRADPQNVDAHVQIGVLLEQQRQPERAARRYERALDLKPAHRVAHWRLGRLKLNQNDATGALAHLTQIRSLVDPASPEILLDLARALALDEDYAQSIVVLEEAKAVAQRFRNQNAAQQASMLLNQYRNRRSDSTP